MEHQIDVMISEEKVDERICELAKQISEDYAGKELHLVVILKSSRAIVAFISSFSAFASFN